MDSGKKEGMNLILMMGGMVILLAIGIFMNLTSQSMTFPLLF